MLELRMAAIILARSMCTKPRIMDIEFKWWPWCLIKQSLPIISKYYKKKKPPFQKEAFTSQR